MKLGIVCANGKEGQQLVDEALRRNLNVTVFVRNKNRTKATKAVLKDLFDLKGEDFKGLDVVLSAFGTGEGVDPSLHSKALKHLCDCLKGTKTRLLVVGGAGSLYVDKAHKTCLKDTPSFPEEYKPVSNAMALTLEELRQRKDVLWTYVSPAADFDPEGKRVGRYALAGEEFTVNKEGKSYISYADYAIAMIDEATKGNHLQERISVYQDEKE